MTKLRRALLIAPLLVATSVLPATAQSRRNRNYDQNRNGSFHNGVRNGGRGGDYYDSNRDPRYNKDRYGNGQYSNGQYGNGQYNDSRYRDRNQGGIGPGKGALIGAGGGAVLGALFGGGLKGTIIGGAAGAGIGAIVGKANQDKRDDRYDRR